MPRPILSSRPILSYCGEQVRRFDNDRFVTSLFAPAAAREGLFALYAFNLELARIREVVKEPLLGEMRLAWWRDTVDRLYAQAPPREPVAQALGDAIGRHHLSRDQFERMLAGRHADLATEPPTDLPQLIDYADSTAGALAQLALQVLVAATGAGPAAARHVGIAWALIGLIRSVPFHARAKRTYLPAALSRDHGLDIWMMFERGETPGLAAVVERITAVATDHLQQARVLRREVPPAGLPVFLAATLAESYARQLARCRFNPFDARVQRRSNAALAKLAANAALGRF